MTFLSLLAFFLAVNPGFDAEMTPADQKRTGMQKLSNKEKRELRNWVEGRIAKKSEPKEPAPTIQENLKNGRYIRLTDGSLWNIRQEDTPITQGWITPVEIKVSPSGDKDYPYKLTNSLTGSSVRARKVESAPSDKK